MDKKQPIKPNHKPMSDKQWAREKLTWVITNCVRSLAAELRRNAAEIERKSK